MNHTFGIHHSSFIIHHSSFIIASIIHHCEASFIIAKLGSYLINAIAKAITATINPYMKIL
ncbi:MAG TPA: hypothetical protein ENJ53_11390 [Phaeodactylibacter sp.]|nr:hypothetical protein [Phaeodactylibacter sp.]